MTVKIDCGKAYDDSKWIFIRHALLELILPHQHMIDLSFYYFIYMYSQHI